MLQVWNDKFWSILYMLHMVVVLIMCFALGIPAVSKGECPLYWRENSSCEPDTVNVDMQLERIATLKGLTTM